MQYVLKLHIGVILLCGLMLPFSACTEIAIDDKKKDDGITGSHGKVNFLITFDNFDENEKISPGSSDDLDTETVIVPLDDGRSMTATLKSVQTDVGIRSVKLRFFKPGALINIVAYEQTGVNTFVYVHHVTFICELSGSLTPTISAAPGETPFVLMPNVTYRFVAYSLNDDTTLPPYALSLTNLDPGCDLIWGDSPLVPIIQGNTKPADVHITMKHKFSNIRLSLTSEIPSANPAVMSDITYLSNVKVMPDCKVNMTVDSGKPSFSADALLPDFEQTFSFPASLPSTSITSNYRIVFTNESSSTFVKIGAISIDGKTYNDLSASFAKQLKAGYEYDIGLKFGDPKELTDDPPPAGFFPYVGAFWRNDQQGERLIRIARPNSVAADGPWTAAVVEGESWITLDTQRSLDNGVWTSGGPTHSGYDNNFESMYPVSGGSMYVSGTLRASGSQGYQSGDEYIYFRIGLKSQQAPGTAPRYGMVLLTYANNHLRQRIWIRQGEEPDYLMRPADPVSSGGIAIRNKAVKISPFNLTATPGSTPAQGNGVDAQLTIPPANPGVFTAYPTQAGALFHWANTGTRTRWAWPPYGTTSGWNATASSGYWDDLFLVHETCPFGYRRFADGRNDMADSGPDMNFSELRHSLFLEPQAGVSSYSSGNFVYGYYADGFFDRRQIGNSTNNIANSTVASNSPQIAYQGALFYNPVNFANIFFPAAGYRGTTGTATGFGSTLRYWTATSPVAASAYIFGGTTTPAKTINLLFDSRQMAMPVRCVNVPMLRAVPQDYERSYNGVRYDSYLMDGNTHSIKVFGNTPWYIKSITDVDRAVSTVFNTHPANSVSGPKQILALKPGDNLAVGLSGIGSLSGETITFSIVRDPSFWGHVEIVFASPTGAFDDYTIKVVFALPRIRLLSNGSGRWSFGANSAAYRMLTDQNNFGTYPDNSIVYSRGFTINHNDNTLPTQTMLDNADLYVQTYGYSSLASPAQLLFSNFVTNDGGVLLSFLENNVNNANIVSFTRLLVQNGSSIAFSNEGNTGGAYRISTINDMITNGPFGDVRGLNWGADSGGQFKVSGLPTGGEVNVYSIVDNLKIAAIYPNDAILFKSNSVPWIYCGDGGYVSSDNNSIENNPFQLDTKNWPAPKNYGTYHATKGSGTIVIHNAALFGNMILWSISEIDYTKKVWADR